MENKKYLFQKVGAFISSTFTKSFLGGFIGGVFAFGIFFLLNLPQKTIIEPNTKTTLSVPSLINSKSDVSLPKSEPIVQSELSITEVVAKTNPSVVSIEVRQQVPLYESVLPSMNDFFGNFFFSFPSTRRQIGTEERVVGKGTGFFVSSDGYIVTNRHVVDQQGSALYGVTMANGKKLTAEVVARDQVFDIAVLKVSGRGYPALTLGDSSTLALGQSVVAIGFALGEFQNSVSTGIISGLSRSITASGGGRTEQLDQVIQTDAAINPGNSGGPLINLQGEVIGVNVAVAQGSQSIGFALPINPVKSIIDSVRQTGTIVRPYIGIRYTTLTPEIARANNLSRTFGILVQRGQNPTDLAVIPGSPADKAGILENDIITALDGVSLEERSFATLLREKRIGQIVRLTVVSKGIEKIVSVTLEKSP